ncbi:MAG: Protein CyaE [Myxococcales bacterium]|nr:Protein CyaE [Myxococcales bacterium]
MTAAILVLFAQAKILTLADALTTAQKAQPTLRQAHANTDAAKARAGEARAPLLPQVLGLATYSRATSNSSAGSVPACIAFGGGTGGAPPSSGVLSWASCDRFNFSLTASQTLWDASGQLARWRANVATAESFEATEKAQRLLTTLTVRTFYFAARANKSLVNVAGETLANQVRHLQQIDGFVKVGTRPEIDLAQARTDRANAQVQLINAENNYAVAKAQLNQAMGVEGPTDYDVEDVTIAPVDGEESQIGPLLDEALKARPEFVSIDRQVQSQELAVWAARTGYGPSLTASTALTDSGTDLAHLVWNWNFTLTVNWQLFSGGLTYYTVKEQKANLDGLRAQRDLLRQQTRLEVDQARLAVRAAKAALSASDEALINARERLRLAEGRYQAGVGSVIELGDAQVALTNAAAQKVQADYNVSTARAQLMKSIGRF